MSGTGLALIDGVRCCPDCGGALREIVTGQPTLFWIHGFGATTKTTVRACSLCSWQIVTSMESVRP